MILSTSELDMTTKARRLKWLHISNKALSGLLALLGFNSYSDEDEVSGIIPMYGMPSSVYKRKSKSPQALNSSAIDAKTACTSKLKG